MGDRRSPVAYLSELSDLSHFLLQTPPISPAPPRPHSQSMEALEFQNMLLKVQDSLSQPEVLELVFLCTDLLRKDLSTVTSATDLFSLLLKEDLLSSEDPSLLTELLRIIKRNKLIQELCLGTQLLKKHISPYRELLYELAENISANDLKNIKFLLSKTLPLRVLEKDVTMLQLFLDLERVGLLDADHLDTIERVIGCNYPRLQTRIKQFKMKTDAGITAPESKWKNKTESQDFSFTKTPVQPVSIPQNGDPISAVHKQGMECPVLYPPSYFSHPQSAEMPASLLSFSGDNVEGQVANLSLSESSDEVKSHHVGFTSVVEEKNCSGPNQQSTLKLEEYPMKGNWRGFCLIINNYDFSNSCISLRNREGTDKDAENLKTVFNWLGFTSEVVRDCSRASMLRKLENLRSRDHKQADCVACCVLTHGYEGGVYGVDGMKVALKELMDPLCGHQCYALSEKPKLFFIQACQGSNEQQVVFLQSDGPNDSMEMGTVCDARVPRESIPSGADFLLAMSTVPNFVSYREKMSGTWFIQSLCKNLQQLVPRGVDLLSILTQVNNDVSSKTDKTGQKKQIPQPEFTLRKRVAFPIPSSSPPS
ncbi:caspase-8 isoform X1 [Pygocentrus nattereri]|uniref:Caspase-8 n=1 Tax=Pygocentrus nattereri TaxID=42514 RepID=A0A3B4CZE3_PYGNA|nr:caspase-8 isoform X1 [Pygocentrus nattereri]